MFFLYAIPLYFVCAVAALNTLTWLLKALSLHETKHQHGLGLNLAPVRYLINTTYKVNSWIPFLDKPETFVKEIRVHPIKSFPALSVQTWKVTEHGLDCDRMYMLGKFDNVQQKWVMVSLRQYASLSKVELRLEDDHFVVGYKNKDYFSVPKTVSNDYLEKMSGSPQQAELWKVDFEVVTLEKLDIQPFLAAVGLPEHYKLLYAPFGKLVVTNSPKHLTALPNYTPGSHQKYRVTKFQDYFPILLISDADIKDLNARLAKEHGPEVHTTSTNFRPNIVIDGPKKPYDTDDWYRFTISGKEWLVASKCPRCSIPNIDFDTGKQRAKQPVSRTLASFRRVDVGEPNLTYFGVNAVQVEHGYMVSVGDRVKLLERRLNRYGELV
ncbi:hypothetical protein KL937_001188 [Ogataea polymorpha]|uniref:uncharacterized protein n=1 Tax=Ogataea polymorpha TaxID=460523 RepID=UPI0007F4E0DC|nr:uncharacterized protein OGAPODRAFT_8560 [Ogataea polymorpha]KAG7881565.1 hypothetical protein KL937_001188 [Ogataea polymorpha]KAG7938655.1 hypothetical protein KL904_001184 [Ogataea polymorpha]OBA15759.1 hypothetical protein OGAPODRAFT_8560 [Ogataea polymorpha]